ncbi:MAG: hypothetical protein Q9M21_05805, partial [Mariprofundaceae bacterium]|nr:hypothetical protein [Mariprofundaceae bacterium]
MVALTKDRNTSERAGDDVSHPIAANVVCFAGGMGAVNAAGNAVPASNTAGLKVVGRIQKHTDNTGGLAGALTVTMKRGVFQFGNSPTSPLTVSDIGGNAVVEDDATVAKAATNNIMAGKILNI